MKKYYIAILLAILCYTSIYADSARIPIYEVTTIASSGHYYLTRDISVGGGNVITIQAHDVTLDLNGHTISSSVTTGYLIYVMDGYTNIRVRNGRLSGGDTGLYYFTSTTEVRIYVSDLEVKAPAGAGIGLWGVYVAEVKDCTVVNSGNMGIAVRPETSTVKALITGNCIVNSAEYAIYTYDCDASEISGNRISAFGAAANGVSGIHISGSQGHNNIIKENKVSATGVSDDYGIRIVSGTDNNIVRDNTVGKCLHGFSVESSGNLVRDNLAAKNVNSGFLCSAGNNLFDNNLSEDNMTYGFNLGGSSNYYRNNYAPYNALDSYMGGTDAGGNL